LQDCRRRFRVREKGRFDFVTDPFAPDGLASNGPLHPALLECLRQQA
jgi:hypothetical protein